MSIAEVGIQYVLESLRTTSQLSFIASIVPEISTGFPPIMLAIGSAIPGPARPSASRRSETRQDLPTSSRVRRGSGWITGIGCGGGADGGGVVETRQPQADAISGKMISAARMVSCRNRRRHLLRGVRQICRGNQRRERALGA